MRTWLKDQETAHILLPFSLLYEHEGSLLYSWATQPHADTYCVEMWFTLLLVLHSTQACTTLILFSVWLAPEKKCYSRGQANVTQTLLTHTVLWQVQQPCLLQRLCAYFVNFTTSLIFCLIDFWSFKTSGPTYLSELINPRRPWSIVWETS